MTTAREIVRLISVDGIRLGYENADAIIAALHAAGFKVLAREPTDKMAKLILLPPNVSKGMWRAMWDAAEDEK